MPTVLLTRHGQTDWNLSKQYQGWGAVPLNDHGHDQARALGTHLAQDWDVEAVYASDLLRVQQTVATVVDEGGASTRGTATLALRERDKGLLQGLTEDEIQAIDAEFRPGGLDSGDVTVAPPDGESYEEMYARVVNWWQDTIEQHADVDGEILVVAHGGSLRCILAYLAGTALDDALEMYYTHNCSLTELHVTPENSTVVETDMIAHL